MSLKVNNVSVPAAEFSGGNTDKHFGLGLLFPGSSDSVRKRLLGSEKQRDQLAGMAASEADYAVSYTPGIGIGASTVTDNTSYNGLVPMYYGSVAAPGTSNGYIQLATRLDCQSVDTWEISFEFSCRNNDGGDERGLICGAEEHKFPTILRIDNRWRMLIPNENGDDWATSIDQEWNMNDDLMDEAKAGYKCKFGYDGTNYYFRIAERDSDSYQNVIVYTPSTPFKCYSDTWIRFLNMWDDYSMNTSASHMLDSRINIGSLRVKSVTSNVETVVFSGNNVYPNTHNPRCVVGMFGGSYNPTTRIFTGAANSYISLALSGEGVSPVENTLDMSTWKFKTKINHADNGQTYNVLMSYIGPVNENFWTRFIYLGFYNEDSSSFRFRMHLNDSNNNSFVDGVNTDTLFSNGTDYYVELGYDGTDYYLKVDTSPITQATPNVWSYTSDTIVGSFDPVMGGGIKLMCAGNNEYSAGTIDLGQTSFEDAQPLAPVFFSGASLSASDDYKMTLMGLEAYTVNYLASVLPFSFACTVNSSMFSQGTRYLLDYPGILSVKSEDGSLYFRLPWRYPETGSRDNWYALPAGTTVSGTNSISVSTVSTQNTVTSIRLTVNSHNFTFGIDAIPEITTGYLAYRELMEF